MFKRSILVLSCLFLAESGMAQETYLSSIPSDYPQVMPSQTCDSYDHCVPSEYPQRVAGSITGPLENPPSPYSQEEAGQLEEERQELADEGPNFYEKHYGKGSGYGGYSY